MGAVKLKNSPKNPILLGGGAYLPPSCGIRGEGISLKKITLQIVLNIEAIFDHEKMPKDLLG